MPGIEDRVHLGSGVVKRQWTASQNYGDDGLSRFRDLLYQRLLRTRQIEKSAGMSFAGKDLFFAQKQ